MNGGQIGVDVRYPTEIRRANRYQKTIRENTGEYKGESRPEFIKSDLQNKLIS
jgi:hypothetical protein